MPVWVFVLCQISVLAYAINGGVFLAFSDFIMRALAKTSGAGGIEAMQSINREVFRFVFMTLLIGMIPVSAALVGYGALTPGAPGAGPIALAGAVYLLGGFGVTAAFNVPLNTALADLEAGSEAAARLWTAAYLPRWTLWNSVRTGACILSAALVMLGLAWEMQARPG